MPSTNSDQFSFLRKNDELTHFPVKEIECCRVLSGAALRLVELLMKGRRVTTDRELVERVRAGDIQAFAALVERYERSVLAVVQAELRDPDAAYDVTKATLVRAFRRLPKLDDGSQFGPWLLKLARRQSINAVRAMPKPVGVGVATGDSDNDFDCCDPEWIEHEQMLGLVTRLPDEDRRLIGLRYFDNYTLPEIADLVGYPVDQVTRRMSLAHMRLQYWWSREQEL